MFLNHTKWALLWAFFILILCAIPGSNLPEVSVVNFDKFAHAFLFFVLIMLTIKGFKAQLQFEFLNKKSILISLISCILYGGLIELAQELYFINRSADIYDFIANSIGCGIGTITYNYTNKATFNNTNLR